MSIILVYRIQASGERRHVLRRRPYGKRFVTKIKYGVTYVTYDVTYVTFF